MFADGAAYCMGTLNQYVNQFLYFLSEIFCKIEQWIIKKGCGIKKYFYNGTLGGGEDNKS